MTVNFSTSSAVSFTGNTEKKHRNNQTNPNTQAQSNKDGLLIAGVAGLAVLNGAMLFLNIKNQKASTEKFNAMSDCISSLTQKIGELVESNKNGGQTVAQISKLEESLKGALSAVGEKVQSVKEGRGVDGITAILDKLDEMNDLFGTSTDKLSEEIKQASAKDEVIDAAKQVTLLKDGIERLQANISEAVANQAGANDKTASGLNEILEKLVALAEELSSDKAATAAQGGIDKAAEAAEAIEGAADKLGDAVEEASQNPTDLQKAIDKALKQEQLKASEKAAEREIMDKIITDAQAAAEQKAAQASADKTGEAVAEAVEEAVEEAAQEPTDLQKAIQRAFEMEQLKASEKAAEREIMEKIIADAKKAAEQKTAQAAQAAAENMTDKAAEDVTGKAAEVIEEAAESTEGRIYTEEDQRRIIQEAAEYAAREAAAHRAAVQAAVEKAGEKLEDAVESTVDKTAEVVEEAVQDATKAKKGGFFSSLFSKFKGNKTADTAQTTAQKTAQKIEEAATDKTTTAAQSAADKAEAEVQEKIAHDVEEMLQQEAQEQASQITRPVLSSITPTEGTVGKVTFENGVAMTDREKAGGYVTVTDRRKGTSQVFALPSPDGGFETFSGKLEYSMSDSGKTVMEFADGKIARSQRVDAQGTPLFTKEYTRQAGKAGEKHTVVTDKPTGERRILQTVKKGEGDQASTISSIQIVKDGKRIQQNMIISDNNQTKLFDASKEGTSRTVIVDKKTGAVQEVKNDNPFDMKSRGTGEDGIETIMIDPKYYR